MNLFIDIVIVPAVDSITIVTLTLDMFIMQLSMFSCYSYCLSYPLFPVDELRA